MATIPNETSDERFFVAGGTVPRDAPSYVERAADRELLEALQAGEFCYVLNSRQMGKSSLAVRTIAGLARAGFVCAFVDLTRLGGANVISEQWYSGLLLETGRALGLRAEAVAYLKENLSLGPIQRFLGFLQEVALENISGPIVVMIDEIDAVRSLRFSTDELFAGIRQLSNERALNEKLNRLTFCLLGAALPSDLIQDPRTTPFNVGRRIELKDFTSDEVQNFAAAMGNQGDEKLSRVFYWTNGHPFLTQSICAELSRNPEMSLDEWVREQYLVERAKTGNTNLVDVANRLTAKGDLNVSDTDRADSLSAYGRMLKGKRVEDDESNPASGRIKMSGIAKTEGGTLALRNRIYESAFDSRWVAVNMPGQELRRQKRAFWKGVLRAAIVSALVVMIISTLAVLAVMNSRRAEANARRAAETERQALYQAYSADMRNMSQWVGQHNLTLIRLALDLHKNDPWRGWEWSYWNRIANPAKRIITLGRYGSGWLLVSPDNRLALATGGGGVAVVDVAVGSIIHTINSEINPTGWLPDSRRFLAIGNDGSLQLIDSQTGDTLKKVPHCGLFYHNFGAGQFLPDGSRSIMLTNSLVPVWLDTRSLKQTPFPFRKGWTINRNEDISPNGRLVAWLLGRNGTGSHLLIADTKTGGEKLFLPLSIPGHGIAFSPDSRRLAVGENDGSIQLLEVGTGTVVASIPPIATSIDKLVFSPDGTHLLVTGSRREATLLKIDGKRLALVRRYEEANDARFLPNHEIAITYWNSEIYDDRQGPDVFELAVGSAYEQLKKSSRGELVALSDVNARIVSPADRKISPPIPLSKGIDYGRFALAQTKDEPVLREKIAPGAGVKKQLPLVAESGVDLSSNGDVAAALVTRRKIVILRKAEAPSISISLGQDCNSVSLSPDGSIIGVDYQDGLFSLFDARTGRLLWNSVDPHWQTIHEFSFSPDGKMVATASDGDEADIWDVSNGKHLRTLIGHSQSVESVAWSPDGKRIATGSDDHTLRIWDAETGNDLGIVGSHDEAVIWVAFLSDGQTLESYGLEGTMKLWTAGSGH